MAETRLTGGKAAARKAPRLRAGRRLQQRHNLVGFHGHGLLALIFLAIVSLSVLGVGLVVASLTIFSVGAPSKGHTLVAISPGGSPSATDALVGRPIDGTIVGISVGANLIAIQPAGGQPVQAAVTAKSTLTRGGTAATLTDLIPGDAVVVTFSQGPGRTLVVATLQDIETVPTNTPSGSLTPLPDVTPTPTATPEPSPSSTPPPGPPGPPGPPAPPG
ncbi:MAG TPA: hypothetical protein VNH20_06020 [Candidatus Dormibacteraeota bacterium]|nr:hypothetical protein [Candidatus Dormibacteraeota bacterium]